MSGPCGAINIVQNQAEKFMPQKETPNLLTFFCGLVALPEAISFFLFLVLKLRDKFCPSPSTSLVLPQSAYHIQLIIHKFPRTEVGVPLLSVINEIGIEGELGKGRAITNYY